jgi:hypothetical protein
MKASGSVPPVLSSDSSPSLGAGPPTVALAGGLRQRVERSANPLGQTPIKAGSDAESGVGNEVSVSANMQASSSNSDGDRAMFPLPIPIASFTI